MTPDEIQPSIPDALARLKELSPNELVRWIARYQIMISKDPVFARSPDGARLRQDFRRFCDELDSRFEKLSKRLERLEDR